MRENDCFARKDKPRVECTALNKIEPGCGTVKCPFYKPDRDLVRKERFNPKTKLIEVTFEKLSKDLYGLA